MTKVFVCLPACNYQLHSHRYTQFHTFAMQLIENNTLVIWLNEFRLFDAFRQCLHSSGQAFDNSGKIAFESTIKCITLICPCRARLFCFSSHIFSGLFYLFIYLRMQSFPVLYRDGIFSAINCLSQTVIVPCIFFFWCFCYYRRHHHRRHRRHWDFFQNKSMAGILMHVALIII